MPEIGTSGLMSEDGKRSVATWPKPPRLSSTLHIRPQRSWRSSSSSSNPICRFGGRWSRSESQDPRFIDGAIFIQTGGPEALDDRSPRPDRVWNRIPDDVRARIVTLALDEPELSPRELAVRFTDAERYFVSEASVYRLLKAHDLMTSPAFIVMKAADEFKDKTTAPNQLWQTDFTYLKVTGWGWFYLSTVLDDFSRYIVACGLGRERAITWAWIASGLNFG